MAADNAGLFVSVQHPVTMRWTIFEDDGETGWLYVTKPNSMEPESDCFVYNRQTPAESLPPDHPRDTPPRITKDFASGLAVQRPNSEDEISLRWSEAGSAALVLLRSQPAAMIVVGEPRGWSKAISRQGPFGHPWSPERYEPLFGHAAAR